MADKLGIPVRYRHVIWYLQICLRRSLIKDLQKSNPDFKVKLYNIYSERTIEVCISEIDV